MKITQAEDYDGCLLVFFMKISALRGLHLFHVHLRTAAAPGGEASYRVARSTRPGAQKKQ